MTRFDRFMLIPQNPMLAKTYAQLSATEKGFVRQFLVQTVRDDANTYATKVNRLFLDEPQKPLHHAAMIEVLLSCNVVER